MNLNELKECQLAIHDLIEHDDFENAFPLIYAVLEEYPDDEPCPSVLIMGFIDAVAYHTVIALCRDHIRVITVYIPEEDKWIEYRRRRNEP